MKKLTQIFTIGSPSYFAAKTWIEEWLKFYRKSRSNPLDSSYVEIIKFLEYILKVDPETEKMFKEELRK